MKFIFRSAAARRAGCALLLVCLALSTACGSTKVYTADKTVIYRDSIYNISNVQRLTAREVAKTPGGQEVDLANMDKNALQDFFKTNSGSMVTMSVEMDDEEMVYLRAKVDDYGEYSRLERRFESAMKDITKFMGDKKKTQLRLQ